MPTLICTNKVNSSQFVPVALSQSKISSWWTMEQLLLLVLLKLACGTLICISALPLCVAVVIFYPYRIFVLTLSKIFRPDLADLIAGVGNVTFALGSDTVPTTNVCLRLTLDGVITVEEVRTRFRKNILNVCQPDGSKPYAKLQQTTTTFMNYGFYRWVKDFNLNEYIRPYDYEGPLALPISEGVTEKDLERIAGKLISLPYAPGKSHWELLVVQNYTPESNGGRKTLLVLRISHAISDGFSNLGLVLGITDTPNIMIQFGRPQSESKIWIKLLKMLLLPARILWDMGTLAVHVLFDECTWKIPREEGEEGECMAVFTKAVHLNVIKTIKNVHGVSYNSVLLTALSSSLHRAMRESGQVIPNKFCCIFPTPKPNHPGGLTNHLFASILPFPIVPDASPSSIAQVDADFKKSSSSTAPQWTELTIGMITTLPLFLVKLACSVWQPSAGIAIFPAISHQLTIEGSLLSDFVSFVGALSYPTANGATIAMGGFNSFQRISICMDKRVFPNERVFSRLPGYIENEIDSMLQSTKSSIKKRA